MLNYITYLHAHVYCSYSNIVLIMSSSVFCNMFCLSCNSKKEFRIRYNQVRLLKPYIVLSLFVTFLIKHADFLKSLNM